MTRLTDDTETRRRQHNMTPKTKNKHLAYILRQIVFICGRSVYVLRCMSVSGGTSYIIMTRSIFAHVTTTLTTITCVQYSVSVTSCRRHIGAVVLTQATTALLSRSTHASRFSNNNDIYCVYGTLSVTSWGRNVSNTYSTQYTLHWYSLWLVKWRSVIGPQHTVTDQSSLSCYSAAVTAVTSCLHWSLSVSVSVSLCPCSSS